MFESYWFFGVNKTEDTNGEGYPFHNQLISTLVAMEDNPIHQKWHLLLTIGKRGFYLKGSKG